ncbi:TlpA disulfide reductase family protein [Rhodococcus ruber]|jgi:thiol-disulfide isomerase/thioredoxin|uniref:Redoxin domain-containing protein n=3 Tax=Actinomycetes TaxID=1760 RepID=H0JYA5_9NOCA|nr:MULTISPECIES: TlpA disulfide reductase family protein [Actinomycetes]AUM19294.1 TlpA family protein disulfide reductase [Rhodococcus ruber]EHK80566.1 Redoxin domain-containing protein [Rhodococcus pyridinivorans AK37]MBD8057183.1 TlpA family protein disulfide reductase [Rhodococcus ruber]MBP2214288.1 thiol-disulfide isomerase/thioredoxin [Rhodococcus ruber]MCD2129725.1 TlpA family protein disulfide reductase [Rhodococcus ruber]
MTMFPPRRRTLLALATTAALAAGATACGTGTTPAKTTAAGGTAKGSVSKDGTEVTTISDEKIQVPGEKPTAVFFFSVGCGECSEGAKSLAKAGKELNGKANVLAVDMDPGESPQLIRQFLDYIKAPQLPAVIDKNATLSQRYQVAALSTLIVVDPAGKVTYRATDPGPEAIQAALEKAGAK